MYDIFMLKVARVLNTASKFHDRCFSLLYFSEFATTWQWLALRHGYDVATTCLRIALWIHYDLRRTWVWISVQCDYDYSTTWLWLAYEWSLDVATTCFTTCLHLRIALQLGYMYEIFMLEVARVLNTTSRLHDRGFSPFYSSDFASNWQRLAVKCGYDVVTTYIWITYDFAYDMPFDLPYDRGFSPFYFFDFATTWQRLGLLRGYDVVTNCIRISFNCFIMTCIQRGYDLPTT